MAHEQFDAWCMNKNILKAYDYNVEDGFAVERMAQEESAYEKLQEMIGLKLVKEQIDKIIANNVIEKERKRQRGKACDIPPMDVKKCGEKKQLGFRVA